MIRITASFVVLAFMVLGSNCSKGQVNTSLTPQEFAKKAGQSKDAIVLDVRTLDEFREGHIEKSLNIDWNGNDFEKQVTKLDKSKPVLVYCLRGARSESAARKMRSMGFKEVFELKGGLAEWQASRMPLAHP